MKKKISLYLIMIFLFGYFEAAAVKIYTPEDGVKLGIQPDANREERIKQHEENIKKLLEERRKKREEELTKKREEAAQKIQETNNAGKQGTEKPKNQPQQPSPAAAVEQKSEGQAPVADNSKPILYFLPLDAELKIGEPLITWVRLFNEKNVTVDEVELYITFDPNFIKPIKVYDTPIKDNLKNKPVFKVNLEGGEIYYHAKLKTPSAFRDDPIIKIAWESLKATEYTEIGYLLGSKSKTTAILSSGTNVLGNRNISGDGVIPSSLRIINENEKITRKRTGEYYEGYTEYGESDDPKAKAKLAFVTDQRTFKAGDIVEIGIKLENPQSLTFDNINLWIKFDPEKFEVVDWDSKNWMRSGINIYDGFARRLYPFDIHKQNIVNNENGEIDYRMGVSTRTIFPTGVFAKIKMKAKQDASINDIFFDHREKNEKPTTSLTRLGKDILDKKTFSNKYDFNVEEPSLSKSDNQ